MFVTSLGPFCSSLTISYAAVIAAFFASFKTNFICALKKLFKYAPAGTIILKKAVTVQKARYN